MASSKMNPMLKKEREGASFNVREMTYLLDGSKERTELKERLARLVGEDPVFDSEDKHFLPREELVENVWKKRVHALKRIRELKLNDDDARLFIYYVNAQSGFSSTHDSMFTTTLMNQTSEEQLKKWYVPAKEYRILGTYAQTELGHGSNVRGLETTAVYDKASKEFIINSPSLTSTKWWPGALGKVANHAIVYARLILDGKDYGIHGFIVPIRSLENHAPLPGVTVGDIGPKLGFNGVDNGFLRLENFRIPRENMLAKYSSISEDGVYKKPPHAKIGYGTMMFIRAYIVYEASDFLARGCTISIRYSAIRQQFPARGSTSNEEIPVLDYQTQQYRLLPLLATCYAFHFTGNYMIDLYQQLERQLRAGDLSLLPLAHATTAGLKAITTAATADGIEECRKCCGGHGYSHLSGLPDLLASYIPACTFEGENVILLLQTASFILKQVASGSFLSEIDDSSSRVNFRDPKSLANAFGLRAKRMALTAAQRMATCISELGGNEAKAWDGMTVELVKMSRAYCFYKVVENFTKALDSNSSNPRLHQVLSRLCQLFALYYIDLDLGDFLRHGVLSSSSEAERVQQSICELLASIRPDAVALVDSFNFPDYLLNSSLGRYNGDAYEHMYNRVQNKGLNSPANDAKLRKVFDQYVKPLQQLQSKL